MTILLTGATGYIGHQLALKLADRNMVVHALVRDLNSSKIPHHKNIISFEGDLFNPLSLEQAIEGCLYVIHTAAFTNLRCKQVDTFYNTNVVGTENLLRVSLNHNIKKFIYTSTLSVFGPSYNQVEITESQPRLVSYANDYELTKAMSEENVRGYAKKGLPSVILNISKVFGPGLNTYSNGVNRLISLIMKKDVLIVPNKLNVTSNYVFIDDVVEAHITALQNGVNSENYIIGGQNINYKDLFKMIKESTKSKIKIITVNYDFLKKCISAYGFLMNTSGFSTSITTRVLDSLFVDRVSSSHKAKQAFNYQSTSFDIGLKHTIQHLLNSKS